VVLTDSHCHLNLNQFNNDLDKVLERAQTNGVQHILVPGIDLETCRLAVHLAETYPQVYAAVGIHPNVGNEWRPETIAEIEALAKHPRVAAIGEIGLDNHWKETDPQLQQEILRAQLDLAARVNKPVVLHSRDALDDLWPILMTWIEDLVSSHSSLVGRAGVLHSYEGNLDTAGKAHQAGFFISLAGPVTYQNAAEKHALASHHPLDNLLIETDSPYLTPHPHRGQRNEPSNVLLVAQAIAKIRNIPLENVAEATTRNADKLFNWSY
jgi:TatD DNase family protein